MNKTKEAILKEFEKRFNHGSYWSFETDEGVEELKSFLDSALDQVRQDTLEEVGKIIPKKIRHENHNDKDEWYACIKCMDNETGMEDLRKAFSKLKP